MSRILKSYKATSYGLCSISWVLCLLLFISEPILYLLFVVVKSLIHTSIFCTIDVIYQWFNAVGKFLFITTYIFAGMSGSCLVPMRPFAFEDSITWVAYAEFLQLSLDNEVGRRGLPLYVTISLNSMPTHSEPGLIYFENLYKLVM